MNAHYSRMQSLLPIAKMVCVPRCVMRSYDIFHSSNHFRFFFLFASKNALLETIEKRTEDNGTPKRVEELENVGERANNGVERSGRYSWG